MAGIAPACESANLSLNEHLFLSEQMGLQTEWFRIGKSGPTVDGRVIKEEWLDDAAKTYDAKNKFTARIWPDHNRYVNYGKVLGVRVVANEDGGKDLFAQLEPNAYYQSDVRYGQKVHFSMEITPDFAKTGKAYLTGLAATDDPASLGTGEAKFTKYAEQAGVQCADFVMGETREFENPAKGLTDAFAEVFSQFFKQQPTEDDDMATKAEIEKLSKGLEDLKAMFTTFAAGGKPTDDKKADDAKLTDSEQRIVDAVAAKFGKQPADDKKADDAKPGNDLATFTKAIVDAIEARFGKQAEDDKTATDADPKALEALQTQFSALQKQLDDALKEQPGTQGGEHFGNQGDSSHLE